MLLECINTSVWNLFIIPEEDWSQSKSIEEYEVNKLKYNAYIFILYIVNFSPFKSWFI